MCRSVADIWIDHDYSLLISSDRASEFYLSHMPPTFKFELGLSEGSTNQVITTEDTCPFLFFGQKGASVASEP